MAIKKRKSIYFLLAFILAIGCSKNNDDNPLQDSRAKVDLVKMLGGSKNESARSVVKTNDGGYAILGYTQSTDGDITDKSSEQYDYWLLKFDSDNKLQWQKTYGGSKDDRGESIIQTTDDGYAIVGYNKSDDEDTTENAGFQDVWILKLDVTGNVSWQKSIGFSGADQGFSIIQTSDGGYFVGGIIDVTASGGEGNSKMAHAYVKHAGGDYWGLKLASDGSLQWRKYFGGKNTDTCYDVIETDDGFILVGSSDSIDVDINGNKGSYDFWIVKIDKEGKLLWEKSLGGKEIDEAYSIVKTSDGNLIIAGESRSNDQDVTELKGAADVWVVKIDYNGDILWQKTFGGSSFDVARSIAATRDSGFVITGSSRSLDKDVNENKGENDIWILKINSTGKLLWQKTIGGTGIDFAYGVAELQDNSIVVVGDTDSSEIDTEKNKGFTDLFIAKIK